MYKRKLFFSTSALMTHNKTVYSNLTEINTNLIFVHDFLLGLQLNTSSLSARRDSFDRNTSAFSPSLDYSSTSAATVAGRKWPVSNYGALGTMASASPLGAPITPPPTG